MIRFGIIRFGSVNDTEASVFGYSVSTRFDRPLAHSNWEAVFEADDGR